MKLNNLTTNILNVGQILKIPDIEDNEKKDNELNIYVVKKGDSLYNIAKKYDTDVDTIKKINNISSNILSIGQKITLPTKDDINEYEFYIVQKGDSLYQIARKYNTDVDTIKKINNLSSNILSIGYRIKVPKINEGNVIYIVKSGDSLYQIAKKYNTTVNDIKSLNNLTTNLLSIGQELKLPR